MGLFLGASFVTVFEVIEMVLSLVFIAFCGSKSGPIESKKAEKEDKDERIKDLKDKVNEMGEKYDKIILELEKSNKPMTTSNKG